MKILVVLIIAIIFMYVFCEYDYKTENMDNVEAIQTLASLYNTGKITTSELQVTGSAKTNTLQLGEKWRLSGSGDTLGNDTWLRLTDTAGKDYYGGFAAKDFWGKTMSISDNITSSGALSGKNITATENITTPLITTPSVISDNITLNKKFTFTPTCRTKTNPVADMGDQNRIAYLNRVMGGDQVSCLDNEYMAGLKYDGSGKFDVKCCKIGN